MLKSTIKKRGVGAELRDNGCQLLCVHNLYLSKKLSTKTNKQIRLEIDYIRNRVHEYFEALFLFHFQKKMWGTSRGSAWCVTIDISPVVDVAET